MTKKEIESHIRSVTRTCRGTLPPKVRKEVNKLMAEGKVTEARDLDASGRSGCGADFNDIIVAGPKDGQNHEYTCPHCGLKGEYKAPIFPKEEVVVSQ